MRSHLFSWLLQGRSFRLVLQVESARRLEFSIHPVVYWPLCHQKLFFSPCSALHVKATTVETDRIVVLGPPDVSFPEQEGRFHLSHDFGIIMLTFRNNFFKRTSVLLFEPGRAPIPLGRLLLKSPVELHRSISIMLVGFHPSLFVE